MKTPVMIDMNLTEDFALGFMAAARSESLDILGITLSFGETDLACAAANTAGLQKLMNTEIPVALGAEKPWRRDYTVEMKKLPLNRDINGLQIDTVENPKAESPFAPDFLYETMKRCDRKVTLLCAGPLTNIAYLLERHPDAPEYIEKLVWRGGTQRHAVNGIVRDMQTLLDPDAASMVFSSRLLVVMCPCDMGFQFYAEQAEIDGGMRTKDPVMHQYNRLLKKRWCEVNEELPMGCRTKPLPLQELAAVLWVEKPELFTTRMIYGEVDIKGKLTFGMLVIDIKNRLETKPEDFNICWINGVDREMAIHYLYGEE